MRAALRFCGSVANFGKLRIQALLWTQLSSERRELLECGLARRLELSFVDHVRDFDAFQCCRC
jgi:hypothetical protein